MSGVGVAFGAIVGTIALKFNMAVNLVATAVKPDVAAFWRFEDLGDGATESESLVDGHLMEFNYAPEPWDSPCSIVP